MSKKHFCALASAIRERLERAKTPKERQTVRQMAEDIANVCAESNRRFKRERFLRACGLD